MDKVKAARKTASSFETPIISIPTETRSIAGRQIRLAEGGSVDAPLVVLLSPFPESIFNKISVRILFLGLNY
jgi:hypothetical protein